jgi:metallophosphoesterase superfamily enzyme
MRIIIRKICLLSVSNISENLLLCSGDLGQSFDSNVTLAHYETNTKAQAVLFVGDLTYADNYPYHDNTRWDTWARFVERNLAYQPWIWTAGNHEIDFAPELVRINLLLFQWMLLTVQMRNFKFI